MAIPGNIESTSATTIDHTPVIIGPADHPITIDQIDKDALHVLKKLNGAGFSGYLVGGGVRDLYLGKAPKDYDISTDARPGQIRKLFPNSTTIGKRFRLVQVFFPRGKIIEVSTLRSLSEHDLEGPEAVLAPNNTFGTLDEDAQRRDLTINSLFFEIEHCTIIDHVNGVKDLDHSIIRMVGDPEKRIHRDPVRMMRAIRHSARNNFTIEEATWKAIRNNADKLTLCPTSRLRDEFFKDLYSGAAACWFTLALDSGIFFSLLKIYKDTLFSLPAKGLSCREQLGKILAVIDRLNLLQTKQNRPKPSQSFILALILIPWADRKYGLSQQQLKGHAIFHFSKKLREDLDRNIGPQLNLRRSIRQEIAMLLTNLPIFMQHCRDGNWPKWLQKKSYFKDSSLFFHFYQEALTDQPVPERSVDHIVGSSDLENREQFDKKKSHRKTKPAFSSRRRGGVFGFKK
jgi:poly(A) polymerase